MKNGVTKWFLFVQDGQLDEDRMLNLPAETLSDRCFVVSYRNGKVWVSETSLRHVKDIWFMPSFVL